MSKLIDSQLVLLSNAAQREDRMVAPPGRLKGPAATKVLKPLLRSRFIEEVPAKGGYPIYRRDPDAGPIALRVTDKGLSVIGVEPQGPTIGPETAKEAALKKGSRTSEPQKQTAAKPKSAPAARERGSAAKAGRQGPKSRSQPTAASQAGAKQALLIEMLQTKHGANIDAIVEATGWLPHTGRAMISGLRKAGFKIEVERTEGKKSVYRIVAGPKAPKSRR
jgi:cell division septation protein DedD